MTKIQRSGTLDTDTEQECLVVVEEVKHFWVYLSHVHHLADHSSLIYLDCMKDENGRLAFWEMALQTYLYTVVYRPGSENRNADSISRQSWPEEARESKEGLPYQLRRREKRGRMSQGEDFTG